MKNNAFTFLEHIAVIIIVGILSTLAIHVYYKTAEKGRAAEVYPLIGDFRAGYQQARMDGLCVNATCSWNPGYGSSTNAAWGRVGLVNPNRAANRFFAYRFVINTTAVGFAPVNANRNVIIAFRRTVQSAYSSSVDTNRWVYMDLDTGEMFRSTHYR